MTLENGKNVYVDADASVMTNGQQDLLFGERSKIIAGSNAEWATILADLDDIPEVHPQLAANPYDSEALEFLDEINEKADKMLARRDFGNEIRWAANPPVGSLRATDKPTFTSSLLPTKRDNEGALDVLLGVYDSFAYGKRVAENAGVTGKRIAAAAAISGVLSTGFGITRQAPEEETAVQDTASVAISSDRIGHYIALPVPDQQDPDVSIPAAAKAGGIPETDISIREGRLYFTGEGTQQASDDDMIAAYIAAKVPEGNQSAVTEEPSQPAEPAARQQVEVQPRPDITPENMTDEQFMDWLVEHAQPTAAGYAAFDVDTSREDAFKDELSGQRIEPKGFVGHWTAGTYENGVDQFISAIKNREGNCCSVMYFMDKDAKVYRFTDSWEKTAHVKNANNLYQGVEIEAEDLRGYTPEQMEAFLYLSLRFLKANDLPIDRTTFRGHEEVDAEYGHVGKIDMPTALVDRLYPKLQELANEVEFGTPIAESAPKAPTELQTKAEAEANFANTMRGFLEFISEDESRLGRWDDVNAGDAGDTTFGTPEYYRALNGKKLTEYTIAEVRALQDQDRIMAVGMFQFIPGTLQSAIEATGIDTSRKFDEAAQTELAVNYLIMGGKRPDLAAWIKGESNDIAAAVESMAYEWASFVGMDGIGKYNGQAGNYAVGIEKRNQQIAWLLKLRHAHDLLVNAVDEVPQPEVQPTPEANRQPNVVLIGDSLTYGPKLANIEVIDSDYGVNVSALHAIEGEALEGSRENTGAKALDQLIASGDIAGADVVYLAYGTNKGGSDSEYEAELRRSIDKIRANSSARIIVPLLFSPGIGHKDSRNEIINRVSKEMDVTVIDIGKDIELSSDDVHPRSYDEISRRILKAAAATPLAPVEPTLAETVPSVHENEAEQAESEITSTTAPEESGPVEDQDETTETTIVEEDNPRYVSGSLWFNRERVEHIYEPAFTVNGEVDTEALRKWVDGLETKEKQDGTVVYEVDPGKNPPIMISNEDKE